MLFLGEGDLKPEIEQACVRLGIQDRVIFEGKTARVVEFLCCVIDVFVMPSLHEGLPVALLEAQAAGLPCLVSDSVSSESLVMKGSVDFIPLSAGVDGWAEATLALFGRPRSPEVLEAMRRSDFNMVNSAQSLADLYASARFATSGDAMTC